MDFKSPELPWARNSLEPYISEETIEYHYGKHHAAYVSKLNELVKGTEYEDMLLEAIVKTARRGTGIYNNACQDWNHTMYWQCLSPRGGGEPNGALSQALTRSFESVAAFRQAFTDAAVSLFGSGWTWLVESDGELEIVSTGNGDTPMREGKNVLLVCDVWEHAYYIDYRNARPKYLEAFWSVVDWEFAATRMEMPSAAAMAGR